MKGGGWKEFGVSLGSFFITLFIATVIVIVDSCDTVLYLENTASIIIPNAFYDYASSTIVLRILGIETQYR